MIPFPLGLRYIAAGAFFFSLMSLLVKLAGQGLPTMEIVMARGVVTLALSAWVLRDRGSSIWGRERGILMLRGVLGFVALSCFYYAVIQLPLAEATVIHYTSPVFTALLAAAFISERIRSVEILLALTSLGGVVLVSRPGFIFGGRTAALDPLGVTAAVAGAILSAGAYVTVRRASRSNEPMVIVFWFALVTCIGALPFAVAVWTPPTAVEWLVLLGVGVATQLGQVFLTKGLKLERAGRAMTAGYLQIVFAALWGAAVFAELPDRWSVAGGLVIIGSTFVLARTRPEEAAADPGPGEEIQPPDPRGSAQP